MSQKKQSANRAATALGLVAVAAVAGLVWISLTSAPAPGESLKVVAVSDVAPLGVDRFVYTALLTLEVSPRDQREACLLVLNREGELLGEPWPLQKGQARLWTTTAPASRLSASSYGPLWLVAMAGPGGCQEARPLLSGARGAAQPLEALAAAMKEAPGWAWGVRRVYVHDKLP